MRRLWCALIALVLLPSLALAQASRREHGNLTADEASRDINVLGLSSAAIQISGTFVATVVFEISNDNTNWHTIACEEPTGSEGVSSATSTGLWFCSVSGVAGLRARVSEYTSGTVTVNVVAASGGRARLLVEAAGTIDSNIVNVPSVNVTNLVPTSAPTYAVSPCGVVSAASTNATSCADAPANWYGVYYAINTTADPAFIRVYNTASAPSDCTAAVTIAPIAIPARSDTAVYGGVHLPFINPINFTTGFGFCVTGAADGTTNAPAGVLILMGVKE